MQAEFSLSEPLTGDGVPDSPPWAYGKFMPLSTWARTFRVAVLSSAMHAGAIVHERLGPRGGLWYAAARCWPEWAQAYKQRSRRLAEGIAAKEAERRLAPTVFCTSCAHWKWHSTFHVFNCQRPGLGARRVGYDSRVACRKYFEPKGWEGAGAP
jgi:hypothetical protein